MRCICEGKEGENGGREGGEKEKEGRVRRVTMEGGKGERRRRKGG